MDIQVKGAIYGGAGGKGSPEIVMTNGAAGSAPMPSSPGGGGVLYSLDLVHGPTTADERYDAQAQLQKTYRPTLSDLIPAPEVQQVIDHIVADLAEDAAVRLRR